MYAIVDIETTGGHARSNGITEIGIIIHDGLQIIDRYQTLINPEQEIPVFIVALTGITNEMTLKAPLFKEVACTIYNLIHDKIFVAHNVNFDYSFLKYHLAACGFFLNNRKLCTVRLGRKIFPGLASYSLGKFSKQMGIENISPHRALGDADTTARLFSMMLSNDKDNHIETALKHHSREQTLPPHLPKECFEAIPEIPGVYYFHNSKNKVIYVGKAKNLKKRVFSHFSNNSPGKQKQDFLRNIHNITFKDCGTELMALILEATEIKRLWPEYNRALKRFEQQWGLFTFEDQKGFTRLAVDRKRKYSAPVLSFNRALDGYNFLFRFAETNNLCPKLCFLQQNAQPCSGLKNGQCSGACCGKESAESYNQRVKNALGPLRSSMPTLAIIENGRKENEKNCILIEQGEFYGMGYTTCDLSQLELVKAAVTRLPSNEYIKNLIQSYAQRFPERVLLYGDYNSPNLNPLSDQYSSALGNTYSSFENAFKLS